MNIKKFLLEKFKIEDLDSDYTEDAKIYFNNAKADAIYCFNFIQKYLDKEKKILEVGGGIHLLTSFLSQDYNITSIEPGGFTDYADKLRDKIISKNNIIWIL